MKRPDLKVVGTIEPSARVDPVKMLRRIADDVEDGGFGDVTTIAIAIATDSGIYTYGGGRDSSIPHAGYLFAVAANRLANIPWGSE
ncbi:MAG: hypothetical protein RIS45_350 [Planctomycetota bacterium]|jgi:hypothetical protein